jgi:hypothetical protein
VDGSLGAATSPVTVNTFGALIYAGTTTTARPFALNDGTLTAASGQTLTFNNTTVGGGFLTGPGSFATSAGGSTAFAGGTTAASANITLNGADSLTNFSQGGQLSVATTRTATFTRVTNTSSGRLTVNGTANVSDFVSDGQLTIPSGGTLNNAGSSLFLGGGSRTTINSGGSINLAGGVTIELNGGLLVNDGTITGTTDVNYGSLAKGTGLYGLVNVGQGGVFTPGNSPGIVTAAAVHFDNTVVSGAPTLEIELAGTTPGAEYDQLHVTGQLSLGGILQVFLIDGFTPASGQSFDVLDWSSLTGTFDDIQLPALTGGLQWNTSQLYTTGILSVAAPSLPGDYNNNGIVDAADYVAWRKGLGATFTQNDYEVWRANFGQQSNSGSGALANVAVPELATAVLLIYAAAGSCVLRRRAA